MKREAGDTHEVVTLRKGELSSPPMEGHNVKGDGRVRGKNLAPHTGFPLGGFALAILGGRKKKKHRVGKGH